MTSEMMVALYSVFAQAESESISNNVKMGKRFGYKAGKVPMMYGNIYGYRKGADGQAEIVPEEAEIIQLIFTKFIEGNSYSQISALLKEKGVKSPKGNDEWGISVIQRMLKNEKYKGDVLVQKSYIVDLFTKKSMKNTGELPMYLVKNHHIPIIEPELFDRAQIELARRNSLRSSSKRNSTGKACYSSKYALTGIVVCGECGSKYRRTTWASKDKKEIVWRCLNRLDYGKKYCKESPTVKEDKLHKAIVNALNTMLMGREKIKSLMSGSIAEILSTPDTEDQVMKILSQINIKNNEMLEIIRQGVENRDDRSAIQERCREKHVEISELQEQLNIAKATGQMENAKPSLLHEIYDGLLKMPCKFTEYDDDITRLAVTKVKILSDTKIEVTLFGSITIESEME